MSQSQPQAAIRRKLLAAARLAQVRRTTAGRALPRAIFVTDPVRAKDMLAIVKRLPRGFGVIWRHFGEDGRFGTGMALARTCRSRGIILLVSADPALARQIRAHGVHWPEKRLKGMRSRTPGHIETAAAHSRAAIATARRLGADAVVLSAVFPSRSPSAAAAMGALKFRMLARNAAIPVYALGGVMPDNAASAMSHAAGWAAVDAVIAGWRKA